MAVRVDAARGSGTDRFVRFVKRDFSFWSVIVSVESKD